MYEWYEIVPIFNSFFQGCGSGSDPHLESGSGPSWEIFTNNRKNARKLIIILILLNILVNLDKLHDFYFWEIYFFTTAYQYFSIFIRYRAVPVPVIFLQSLNVTPQFFKLDTDPDTY